MSNVLRRVALVGSMTAISRVAGLAREMLMAHAFGTGLAKSAFDVAFRIPNLFRRLFGEGALSAALIPVYTETREREGPEVANRLVGRVAGLSIAVLGLVTALGILLLLLLEQRMQFGPRWTAIMPLLRIMLPYAPLICLAALIMGVLNSLRHFAIPALAPVFLNLVWILVLVGIFPWLPDNPFVRIRAVAWGVLAAGAIQVAVQLPVLARHGVRLLPSFHWRNDPRLKRILTLMAPMAIGAGLIQINVCFDSLLAMWAATWGPSALEYAERLVYLPLGLVGNAFGTVLLPTLSAQAVGMDRSALSLTLERALRNIAVIMSPLAVGLTVLALPAVTLVYRLGDGAFQGESARQTARALAGYAPGLLVFSFYKALTPAFYAMQDTRTPMRVGLVAVVLNLCLNILFVVTWPAGWKHMGIAVATVITSLVNCVTLGVILKNRCGAPRPRKIMGVMMGALAASLVMAPVALALHRVTLAAAQPHMADKLAQIAAMILALIGGGSVYFLATTVLCRRGLLELWQDLRWKQHSSTPQK